MKKKDLQVLKSMKPCEDGFEFAKKCKDFRMVWEKCERSDWMGWLLKEIAFRGDKKLRLYACKCIRETTLADGRKVWDLLTDARSREAVEVAERFAEGNATEEEIVAAATAASAVAATSASYVAAYAAYSASAYYADYAYYAASAAAADDYSASARKEQCGMLRSLISWDEVEPFYKAYSEGVK